MPPAPADPEADFLCCAFPHPAQELQKKNREAAPCFSLFHLLGGKELQHQSLCPQPLFSISQGLLCPSPVFPQQFGDREPLAGFSRGWERLVLRGCSTGKRDLLSAWVFPPQLPNTLLERNIFNSFNLKKTPQIRGRGVEFKAPEVLPQEHHKMLFFLYLLPGQPLSELQPTCLLAHNKRSGHSQFQLQQSSVKGDTAALLPQQGHPWLCGEQGGLCSSQGKGLHGDPLDKGTAQGRSAADPSHSNDSLEHSASSGMLLPAKAQCPSKLCIQGDRIVTAHLPLLPLLQAPGHAAFPLLVPTFRPVTPFPAWILSLEKRNEILILFFNLCVDR